MRFENKIHVNSLLVTNTFSVSYSILRVCSEITNTIIYIIFLIIVAALHSLRIIKSQTIYMYTKVLFVSELGSKAARKSLEEPRGDYDKVVIKEDLPFIGSQNGFIEFWTVKDQTRDGHTSPLGTQLRCKV